MSMFLSPSDFKNLNWSDVKCPRALPSANPGTLARKLQDCISVIAFELNRVLQYKGYKAANRYSANRYQESV